MARRVLVVDDDAAVRSTLAQLLERTGFEVMEAANGKVAMRQISRESADLVVIDMLMPEMEGAETIFALRRFFPGVRIIAVSGGGLCSAEAHLQIARALGSDKILSKPLIPDEFLNAVREMIGEGQNPPTMGEAGAEPK
jgi:DNA-binding response OmpR family regulator